MLATVPPSTSPRQHPMALFRHPLCTLGLLIGVIVFAAVLFCLGFFRVDLAWAAGIAFLCAAPLTLAIAWEDIEKLMGNRPESDHTKSVH